MNLTLASVSAPEIPQRQPTLLDALSEVMAIQLRNIEAFTKAQHAMMDSNKTLAGQQLESALSTTSQAVKAAHDIMSESDWKVNLRLRFTAMKASMRDGIGNVNTLAEISARSGAQAAQITHDRSFEALDEMQAVLERMWSLTR